MTRWSACDESIVADGAVQWCPTFPHSKAPPCGRGSEVIERDRVLRHWYAGIPPRILSPVEVNLVEFHLRLSERYDWVVCEFSPPWDYRRGECRVTGVFGFPKANSHAPFTKLWFWLSRDSGRIPSALPVRTYQRLGFLWDEDFSGRTSRRELFSRLPPGVLHAQNGICQMREWIFADPSRAGWSWST